jgi:hypothetical protein
LAIFLKKWPRCLKKNSLEYFVLVGYPPNWRRRFPQRGLQITKPGAANSKSHPMRSSDTYVITLDYTPKRISYVHTYVRECLEGGRDSLAIRRRHWSESTTCTWVVPWNLKNSSGPHHHRSRTGHSQRGK